MKDSSLWSRIDKYSKKLKAINYLGGCCSICGETHFFKLCFHHTESENKEFNISNIKNLRWSKIEEELNKCVLLCHNCHYKVHYENDKKNRYKTNKKTYLEYKRINSCEKCGYEESDASLDFHHIDKNNKDFNMGEINITYSSLENLTYQLEKELDKCVVLCKNCHSLEHSDTEFFEKNKELIIKRSENLKEIQGKIDRDKVKELYNSGMRQVDIAKYFNAKKGTISDIIKKLGIKK